MGLRQLSVIQRNNVQVRGGGARAMVFAHGFGCDLNMWRFVAPAFEDRFKSVLFDHVGAGRSDLGAYDPAKYATLSGYADDVVEIGHELGLKNAVFVGHSVSAMIGVLAAQKAPEIFESLVMVGPSPRYIDDEDMSAASSKIRSRNCSSSCPTITWAGPRPWRRRSWAIPIGRNSARN